ncbi:GCN5-related protein N-acetyltransferase [Beutenbergia cavernae DSM 12333]|uniref:GCN5-related protein N-acetyltransferase n=1 Tax=Beutenbergia cavernae (strain ATCC BAA-8 / DSM 12333 / CCUG 43141 / JCM 11478 / NBRC 16432 / NCIMB 13614 / HKI 0122) TaxID=471853 RepID=C5BWT1_BEUC1|nr:DUF4081 domain-containing GNAT family N-acetyltransferase [Beutenbergia cavernae]ACQ80747.1 GCN5-related protein N-acetyltransferase [Beutenbergia cavernae DSM 12333]
MPSWSRVKERPADVVRPLEGADREAALDLCHVDPVGAVLAGGWVEALGTSTPAFGEILGAWSGGELVALCWAGANLVPVSPDGRGIASLATAIRDRGRRCSSIVGDAPAVLGLWERLGTAWSTPREVRADQPSMTITADPRVPADPGVRLGTEADLDVLLPACVAMFTEEYGYSPVSAGGGYEGRVRQLVVQGRSFVRLDDGPAGRRVAFKAELGAVSLGVAQIQGVWVHPELRGRGVGAAGMAAVVDLARQAGAGTMSLYVNAYNTAARAVYDRVGFTRVGTYATIVF